MTPRTRKLALQITPLLDTLLVVLFLQYLDAHQKQAAVLATADAAQRGQAASIAELEGVRTQMAAVQTELAAERARTAASEREVQLQEAATRAETQLDQALAQQRVLGQLLAELFQIPDAAIAEVLDPNRDPPVADSPQEVARLRARFEAMAEARPGAVIRHLLSYEEIRKRCDLWEVIVDGRGVATFVVGDTESRLRIEPATFEAEFFERYKALPQSKGLVIILLTYERAAQRRHVLAVRQSLPRLVNRMREDSGGVTRFEYADLGVRID